MLGLLIFLTIILVLILINKNTKSSPDGMGCIQQGCLVVIFIFVMASWSGNGSRRGNGSGNVPPVHSAPALTSTVMFTEVTMADASNPSVHRTSYDCSTTKIIVNCRVIGATPGTPLTGKWFLLGSGTKQLLQEATAYAAGPSHPAFFSAARPSNQLWPVGTYEVELFAGGVLHKTLTFWVVSNPERSTESSVQEPEPPAPKPDRNRRMWDPND